jgi:hypothetical protein
VRIGRAAESLGLSGVVQAEQLERLLAVTIR